MSGPVGSTIGKVGHYVDSAIFGGCEHAMVILAAEQQRRGLSPVIFHHRAEGLAPLVEGARDLGVPCRVLDPIGSGGSLNGVWRLAKELRDERLSVFHAHLSWPLACAEGLVAARLARVPKVVATSQLYCALENSAAVRLRHRAQSALIDQYIAVSDAVAQRLSGDLGIRASRITVVRNGIDADPFQCGPEPDFREALGGVPGRPLVLTVARLHSQKGHEYLLQAARLVEDAVFLFAGEGPERLKLEALSRTLGLDRRVHFLGHRTDVPRLLANCDIFVLPSLYEGFPLVILEAMAAGRPIVSTRIGGTDEAVVHGESGLLVPPEDPQGLAQGILEHCRNPEIAARMAARARARVVETFSARVTASSVAAVYAGTGIQTREGNA